MTRTKLSSAIIEAMSIRGAETIVFYVFHNLPTGMATLLFWECCSCGEISVVVKKENMEQGPSPHHRRYPRLVVCAACLHIGRTVETPRFPHWADTLVVRMTENKTIKRLLYGNGLI